MKKTNKGFTLVELIVVIGVLALLAIGAVLAFQNVQRNARLSAANSDAARLADGINTFNSSVLSASRITDQGGITGRASAGRVSLVIPGDGGILQPMDVSVSFGTTERRTSVQTWIDYGNGIWTVNQNTITAAVN